MTRPATAGRSTPDPLRAAGVIFAIALVVHGADHLRRGMDVLSGPVFWAGNLQIGVSLVTLWLIFRGHPLAPAFAIGLGFASAVGFTVAHLVPDWGSFSGAFTGAYPAPHVTWFSWLAAVFEIAAGLLLGAAGVGGVAADASRAVTTATRDRIRDSAAELFRRQGYYATGVKQIVGGASAQLASLYHFFPGGKEALGAEVIGVSGAGYQALVEGVWDAEPDVVAAVQAVFAGAADVLEQTEYADACPIATVALEVASVNEALRIATADVFDAWVASLVIRLRAAGIAATDARRLALVVIGGLEGAFVLARALRSTEPLAATGSTVADAVAEALAARP